MSEEEGRAQQNDYRIRKEQKRKKLKDTRKLNMSESGKGMEVEAPKKLKRADHEDGNVHPPHHKRPEATATTAAKLLTATAAPADYNVTKPKSILFNTQEKFRTSLFSNTNTRDGSTSLDEHSRLSKKRKIELNSGTQVEEKIRSTSSIATPANLVSKEPTVDKNGINVGDSVYGFWSMGTECLSGGGWYEGTVKSHRSGGLFHVSFNDRDERVLPSILIVPKNEFGLYKAQMALLREGSKVYAPRWRNETKTGEPKWHPGVIKSSTGSALRSVFCVEFDDDREAVSGIKASLVFPRRSDGLNTMKGRGEALVDIVRDKSGVGKDHLLQKSSGVDDSHISFSEPPELLAKKLIDGEVIMAAKAKSSRKHVDGPHSSGSVKAKSQVKRAEEDMVDCQQREKNFATSLGLAYHSGDEDDVIKALICPHCEKNFASKLGLSYHLDKKVCQQRNSNDIYLSLKNDDYKAVMFAKFHEIYLGKTSERMTDVSNDLFDRFKQEKQDGKFFKFDNVSSDWVVVDECTALAKIKADLSRRMETYKYWGSQKHEDQDSCNDTHGHYCFVCNSVGELICCDSCNNVCHKECHYPELQEVPDGEFKCYECSCEVKKNDEIYAYQWCGDGDRRVICLPGLVKSFNYKRDKAGISRFCWVQLTETSTLTAVQDVFVIPKDKYFPGRILEEGSKVYAPWPKKKGDPKWYQGTVVSSIEELETGVKYSINFDSGQTLSGICGDQVIPMRDQPNDTTGKIQMEISETRTFKGIKQRHGIDPNIESSSTAAPKRSVESVDADSPSSFARHDPSSLKTTTCPSTLEADKEEGFPSQIQVGKKTMTSKDTNNSAAGDKDTVSSGDKDTVSSLSSINPIQMFDFLKEKMRSLEDELGDTNDTLTQQMLFTNFLQTKFDDLASLAERSGVDRAAINEIRSRPFSGVAHTTK